MLIKFFIIILIKNQNQTFVISFSFIYLVSIVIQSINFYSPYWGLFYDGWFKLYYRVTFMLNTVFCLMNLIMDSLIFDGMIFIMEFIRQSQ